MFPKLKFTAEQIGEYYAHVTPDMVRASLAASRGTFFDLMNLLSPEAARVRVCNSTGISLIVILKANAE